MGETNVVEFKMPKEEAEAVIRQVIDELTEGQQANLLNNIKAGRKLHCGSIASIFSDENAGCMLTLATTTDLPDHKLDLEKKERIDEKALELYCQVVQKHTLRYYIATTLTDEETFKAIILSSLQGA